MVYMMRMIRRVLLSLKLVKITILNLQGLMNKELMEAFRVQSTPQTDL